MTGPWGGSLVNDDTADRAIRAKFAGCRSKPLWGPVEGSADVGSPGGFPAEQGGPGGTTADGRDHGPRSGSGPDDGRRERLLASIERHRRSWAMSSGLSTAHISPRGDGGTGKGAVTVHEGGSLMQLTRPTGSRTGGGLRGKVAGFSGASRKRLIRFMASINETRTAPAASFVTLTYPGRFPAHGPAWKRDLDAFCKALNRDVAVQAWVWKLEPQKRWAPHFHLVVFSELPVDPAWVASTWWRIVGERSPEHLAAGTSAEPIKSWAGVAHYSAKYIAKIDHADDLPEFWKRVGRWWGKGGTFSIDSETVGLGDRQFFALRRVCRRWVERQTGRRCRTWQRAGITLFCRDATQQRLLGWAEKS